jgi:Flp pilus assembly pilin Flp
MDLLTTWQRTWAPSLRARFGRSERGANLVEYALLMALIALVCFAAVQFFGNTSSTKMSTIASSVCPPLGGNGC